jgi:hypothetical protein
MSKSNAFEASSDDEESTDIVEKTMRYLLLNGGAAAQESVCYEATTPAPPPLVILNAARKILAWSHQSQKTEVHHLDFVVLATQQRSVDDVLQSLEHGRFRRTIVQGLLRAHAIIAAGDISDSGAPRLLFFDDFERSFDDVMLISAVLIAVHCESLFEDGVLSTYVVSDLMWVVRWVGALPTRSGDARSYSLCTALCVLI